MTRRADSWETTNTVEDLDSPADAIETGCLAIRDDEKTQQKELWERSATILDSDGSTVLRFEILAARIMPPEGSEIKAKRFVVYEITVRQDSSTVDPNPATFERRYSDFRTLYMSLKKNFPGEMTSVYFPNKVLMGNFSTDLIAERSASFENLLKHIVNHNILREDPAFLYFLQHNELTKGCQLLDERRNENAIFYFENCFRLVNKIFMDRSRPVLLLLLRLIVASTTSPVPHHGAEKWALLALSRYDTLCDVELLELYIPLLHTISHLWWQKGLDQTPITQRLTWMAKRGINTSNQISLIQAIQKLDPRTEIV